MNDIMEATECPICMIDLSQNNILFITPCNHTFCKSCIVKHAENKYIVNCPICRHEFEPTLKLLENETLSYQYHRLSQAIKSKDSRELKLSEELVSIVKFTFTEKDEKLLNFLKENPKLQPDFLEIYENTIKKGMKYFDKIEDPYKNFALTWLFYLYH